MKEDDQKTRFHETQRLRQWHVRIMLAMPPAALLFITVRQVACHHPWGHPPMSNGGLLFLTILLLLVYVRLITVRLVTDLSHGELTVGLRGLRRKNRVPLAEIKYAAAVRFDPVSEYGGYGIRSGPRGLAYIASGNRAVQLELRDGHKLLVGSQRPEELALKILQGEKRPSLESPHMSKKTVWNMTIGFSGIVYLVLAFCKNIQSPLFAVLFVLVAGYEVVGSHTSRHRP